MKFDLVFEDSFKHYNLEFDAHLIWSFVIFNPFLVLRWRRMSAIKVDVKGFMGRYWVLLRPLTPLEMLGLTARKRLLSHFAHKIGSLASLKDQSSMFWENSLMNGCQGLFVLYWEMYKRLNCWVFTHVKVQ